MSANDTTNTSPEAPEPSIGPGLLAPLPEELHPFTVPQEPEPKEAERISPPKE